MIIVLIMLAVNDEYSIVYYYKSISNIFPVLAVCETAILVLVIPIMTSGSISGERERQTLDIMLTTPIKPIAIVAGKLLSAILTVAMYVISSVPLLAISFILGGVKSQVLFEYIGMVLFLGIYVGSIGIFFVKHSENIDCGDNNKHCDYSRYCVFYAVDFLYSRV